MQQQSPGKLRGAPKRKCPARQSTLLRFMTGSGLAMLALEQKRQRRAEAE